MKLWNLGNPMDYIETLKNVLELITVMLTFAPLAAEMPWLLPLAGIIALLLWLDPKKDAED